MLRKGGVSQIYSISYTCTGPGMVLVNSTQTGWVVISPAWRVRQCVESDNEGIEADLSLGPCLGGGGGGTLKIGTFYIIDHTLQLVGFP